MNTADIQALTIDIMACEDTIAAAADLLGVNPTDLDDAIEGRDRRTARRARLPRRHARDGQPDRHARSG